MLDFARIKEIKLTDVLLRYKIPLRFKGEYAACACPLPTHKKGDMAFAVRLDTPDLLKFTVGEVTWCRCGGGLPDGARGADLVNRLVVIQI